MPIPSTSTPSGTTTPRLGTGPVPGQRDRHARRVQHQRVAGGAPLLQPGARGDLAVGEPVEQTHHPPAVRRVVTHPHDRDPEGARRGRGDQRGLHPVHEHQARAGRGAAAGPAGRGARAGPRPVAARAAG
ncbi:hypothetical protein G5V59_17245 [Nocardioides sp. W3-2-3]|nr:hypothetical protein [Nocardioides convexus]